MVVVEDRYAVFPLCVADWEHAIEIDTAVVEGPGQSDGVGVDRRDEIGAGRKVLGTDYPRRT